MTHAQPIEALPVEDGWADVVISKGVLNLMPDKDAALAEMARVLAPGGRLHVGDILVQQAVPPSAKRQITWRGDVLAGAPQSSSAGNFGTLGITFRARKAASDDEWQAALAALSCGTPAARQEV